MSVFVKPLMDWFMFGMVIETGSKFYVVPFPTQKVTDSEFLYISFVINVLNGFNQLLCDDRALSKILCSTIPIPVLDLKIKVTDFEFFCVKSLQFQLLQSLWLIWIVFGMNGYKILKCFGKEKRVSGELPCPATGLINIYLSKAQYFAPNVSFVSNVKKHKRLYWYYPIRHRVIFASALEYWIMHRDSNLVKLIILKCSILNFMPLVVTYYLPIKYLLLRQQILVCVPCMKAIG